MDAARLRERLRQVVGGHQPPEPIKAQSAATPTVIEEVLGGEWRVSDAGRTFVVTRRFASDSRYGAGLVGDFAEALSAPGAAAALVGGPSACAPFVFLDLETTGLSGGAGTHAFIVGCGWFEGDGTFVTEQHLLVDYVGERAMLERVAGEIARSGTFVTFNGKSFDAPVIETRYLFHRLTSPCADRPHLDLLHPSRRFWGGINPAGCSLTTLEHDVLGASRVGDVPGFEIPARYFEFVRSGDGRSLAAVLEHNRLDLLSLAGLTSYLFGLIEAGPAAARHAQEALALGRVYERAGWTDRAEAAYEQAAASTRPEQALFGGGGVGRHQQARVHIEALRALALGARRRRRFERAAEKWRQLLAVRDCPKEVLREATEALAIHHEHRVRDLAAAKMFAMKSLEEGTGAAWGDAVRHRLARIERKLVNEPLSLFPSSPLQPQPSFDCLTSGPRTSS